jgi:hypothetical protein
MKKIEVSDAERKAMLNLMVRCTIDEFKGNAITKRWASILAQYLKFHLPRFFETDEGKAIKESAERAENELFGKKITGKCTDKFTEEDIWVESAARNPKNLAHAIAVSYFNPRWTKLLMERGDKMIARAIAESKKKKPDLTEDENMVWFWVREIDFAPPLCFWSDQAGADKVTRMLNDKTGGDEIITADTYRVWRSRWKLKKSSITLIKKFSVGQDDRITIG